MGANWNAAGRSWAEHNLREYLGYSKRQRLWARIDAPLLASLLGLVLSACLLLWIAVQAGARLGLFEWEGVRPLADERLLVNVREQLADQSLLAAVTHAADGGVYISQEGGLIHRYDPLTHLWSMEIPAPQGALSDPNFTLLRSGCGSDPLSARLDDCPDPEPLWGLTASGALVRRAGGRWDILLGDTRFVGSDGRPVQSESLTSAAISDDGQWLMLGAQRQGIGLYNLNTHDWVTLSAGYGGAEYGGAGDGSAGDGSAGLSANLPSSDVSHIVWWRDQFWIGAPDGLARVSFPRGRPQITQAIEEPLHVMDLDVDRQNQLWALGSLPCENGASGCLWLGRFSSPDGEPQVAIDEANRFQDLDFTRLIHAQLWGEKVALAGDGGIFTYDPAVHSWAQVYTGTVQTTLDLPEKQGFYFSAANTVGLAQAGEKIRTWSIPDTQINRLLYGPAGRVLAFTQSGSLYAITPQDTTAAAVYRGSETKFDPAAFRHAAAYGDQVLLAGPQGALLHNVRTRSYLDIQPGFLPAWLAAENAQFFTSGAFVYVLADAQQVYPVPADLLFDEEAYQDGRLSEITALDLPAAVVQTWIWQGAGIGMLAADGSLYRANQAKLERLSGPAVSDLDNLQVRDAALLGDDLVLATDQGVIRYDGAVRKWGSLQALPDDSPPLEVAVVQNTLLALSDSRRLYALDGNSFSARITAIQPALAAGERQEPLLTDEGLSDAFESGGLLYMAGVGNVAAYDPARRAITNEWKTGAGGGARILAVVDGKPLVFGQSKAWLGDQQIDAEAGDVLSISIDQGLIWMVRQGEAGRYLKSYPLDNPLEGGSSCFFRSPAASGVSSVSDARLLPDNVVAVSTDQGLWFYRPDVRSWSRAEAGAPGTNSRLYTINNQLVVVSPGPDQKEITMIPLDSLVFPDSCSLAPVQLTPSDFVQAREAAVNEANGQIVWVEANGSVTSLVGGRRQVLLPETTPGPNWPEVRRVYERGDHWIFATGSHLWFYTHADRSWRSVSLNLPPDVQVRDINVETWQDKELITVAAGDGRYFSGALGSQQETISLDMLYTPPQPGLDAPVGRLLDAVQPANDQWALLYPDRVRFFDPAARRWSEGPSFEEADATRTYMTAAGVHVITGGQGKTWWVRQGLALNAPLARYERKADEITALDGALNIWRYLPDGSVWSCQAPANLNYDACQQVKPPASLLDPAQVQQAFAWKDWIWMATAQGLSAFDAQQYQAAPLAAELGSFGAVQSIRSVGDRLFVFRPGKLVVATKLGQTPLSVSAYDGASRIAFDADNTLWAYFPGGWRVYSGGQFVAPAGAPERVFAADGLSPLGLDGRGQVYTWRADRFEAGAVTLPLSVRPQEVFALLYDGEMGWWVVGAERVLRYQPGACPTPAAAAPTPTPGTPTPGPGTPAAGAETPTAIPAAPPATCMLETVSLPLPAGVRFSAQEQAAGVRLIESGLEVYHADGVLVRVTEAGAQSFQADVQNGAYQLPNQVDDEWARLRRLVVTLPNGQTAFNAIQSLRIAGTNLVTVRPGGEETLADGAALASDLRPLPALDAGWLTWDRGQNSFSVRTSSGRQSFTANELLVQGRFIFEPVEAVLVLAPDNILAANTSGVWAYTRQGLPLNDASIRYQSIRLSSPILAAHGRFFNAAMRWSPGEAAPSAHQPTWEIRRDDAYLVEEMTIPRVSAFYRIQGANLPADLTPGFLWDANRRAVAWSPNGVVIQTDAGLLSVDRLAGFDLGPNNLAQTGGRLFSEADRLYLQEGGGWWEKTGAGWQAQAADPAANRNLVQNGQWTWSLRGGGLQVRLAADPRSFQLVWNTGLGFNFDLVNSAAVDHNRLYVDSRAFLEIAASSAEIASLSAGRLAPLSLDALEQWRVSPGVVELWCYRGASALRWNASTQTCEPPGQAADPREERLLVDSPLLRFTWINQHVAKAMSITEVAGSRRWAPFLFDQGRFPFDVIRSLAAFDGKFYLGTNAGLQILPANGAAALGGVQMIDVQDGKSQQLVEVHRVGIPVEDEALLMVNAGDACYQKTAGGSLAPCSRPSRLADRMRIHNSFWQWVLDESGLASGRYLDESGRALVPEIHPQGGRLPHDGVAGAVTCGQQGYTVWQNGWISQHPGQGFRIADGILTYTGLLELPARLACIEEQIALPGKVIEPGLYAVNQGGGPRGAWRLSGGAWQAISDGAIIDALDARILFPPVYESGRLRLLPLPARQKLAFEQMASDNRWHNLEWQAGRVQIDHWRTLLYADQRLWAATAAGLVAFEIDAGGRARLDPGALAIIREPFLQGSLCPVTDMAVDGERVLVRCSSNSSQVFAGRLDPAQQRAGFKSLSGADPFATQAMVDFEDSRLWKWELVDRTQGKPGYLQVTWQTGDDPRAQSEALHLAGGRFPFDEISSLAFFVDDQSAEVGSSAGWFKILGSQFQLQNWRRPDMAIGLEPEQIVAVGLSQNEGREYLCLKDRQQRMTRLADGEDPEQVSSCPEFQGSYGGWRYEVEAQQLAIVGIDLLQQAAARTLIEGRFSDDWATGLPVTAQDADGPYYLIPTKGGVVRTGQEISGSRLLAGAPAGAGTPAEALYMIDPQTPAYLQQGTLYNLMQPGTPAPLTLNLPADIHVIQLDDGPHDSMHVGYTSSGGAASWGLLNRQSGEIVLANGLFVDVQNLRIYQENRARWGSQQSLVLSFEAGQINAIVLPGQQVLTQPLPAGFELLIPLLERDRVILVGRHEIYEINLARILRSMLH